MHGIGEEVACIGDEEDDAALDLWLTANMREFEQERCPNADCQSDDETAGEDQQEDAKALEELDRGQGSGHDCAAIFLIHRHGRLVALRRLEEDNGDCVVEDRFTKNDRVEVRIDLVGVEDGQDGDGIGGRQGRADRNCLDKGEVHGLEWQQGPEEENDAKDNGRYEGSEESKSQDRANVSEEVALLDGAGQMEDAWDMWQVNGPT